MDPHSIQWEYKTEKLKLGDFLGGKINKDTLDQILNEAGAAGWELVSVLATALYQGRTQDVAILFKRPKQDAA